MSLNFSPSLLPSPVSKHEPVVVLDQEAAERQGNAVALIGRNATLPQGFRHDAEHGAAVEALRTALQCVTPEPAHLEGRVGHSNAERGTRKSEQQLKIAGCTTLTGLFRVPRSHFRVSWFRNPQFEPRP